jgi:hypothetical protein
MCWMFIKSCLCYALGDVGLRNDIELVIICRVFNHWGSCSLITPLIIDYTEAGLFIKSLMHPFLPSKLFSIFNNSIDAAINLVEIFLALMK